MANGGVVGFGDRSMEIDLKRFEEKVYEEIKRIVAETAEIIASTAKALAPESEIDGGSLKRSIDVEYLNGGLSAKVIVGAHYAVYVEHGTGIYAENGNGRKTPWVYFNEKTQEWVFTRGMAAQPFWRPALEAGRQHFNREMRKLG